MSHEYFRYAKLFFNLKNRTCTAHFMDFKKTFKELNMLLPFSVDINV